VSLVVMSELSQYSAQAGKLTPLMMLNITFARHRMLSLEFMRSLQLMMVLGMKTVKKFYHRLLFICLCRQTRSDALLEKVGISSKESAVTLVRKYVCSVTTISLHVPLMVTNFFRLVISCINLTCCQNMFLSNACIHQCFCIMSAPQINHMYITYIFYSNLKIYWNFKLCHLFQVNSTTTKPLITSDLW
jgi:hypothetical protein